MGREGLNECTLIGNLGADPEMSYIGDGGKAKLKLRLATTERYMSKSGERQEKTQWHSVIFWDRRAEGLNKFLTKGMTVAVTGSIEYHTWDKDDGTKGYATEIRGRNLVPLGGGDRDREGGGGRQGQSDFGGGGSFGGGGGQNFGGGGYDDDVPFAEAW